MITIILFALAGMCNAVMDVLMSFFETSRLNKLNPLFWDFNKSHGNKWKNGDKAQGERFLFSSTILVGLTDGWHLFKTIMILLIVVSLITQTLNLPFNKLTGILLVDFLILYSSFTIPFELFYKYLKNDEK